MYPIHYHTPPQQCSKEVIDKCMCELQNIFFVFNCAPNLSRSNLMASSLLICTCTHAMQVPTYLVRRWL